MRQFGKPGELPEKMVEWVDSEAIASAFTGQAHNSTPNTPMLIILSPSKTQSVTLLPHPPWEQPLFSELAAKLMEDIRRHSVEELRECMKLSGRLAEAVSRNIRRFKLPHSPDTAGSALATFQGDAFSAITAEDYSSADLLFAQQHIRILSGLYGILRPLDLIQPHRLEMATKGISLQAHNLYKIWTDPVTQHINEELSHRQHALVLNCASAEYSRVISRKKLNGSMVAITFKQKKKGIIKTVPIHAKRARGMFAHWFLTHRIDHPERLPTFAAGGYRFETTLSRDDELVFITDLD